MYHDISRDLGAFLNDVIWSENVIQKFHRKYVHSALSAGALTPLCAKASAGTVMTYFGFLFMGFEGSMVYVPFHNSQWQVQSMPGFSRETGQIKEFVPQIQFVKSQNPVGHLGQSKFHLSIFAKISANGQKRWCSLSISSTAIIVTSHERHGVSNH